MEKGQLELLTRFKIYQLTRNKKTAVFRLNKELEFKMRFGWLTLSLSSSPHEDKQNIDNVLIQAQEAERLGFEDVWLTEHYFTGESVYNDALLFAAALAMKTEKKSALVFQWYKCLFHHPVRLATQLALLDNLSNGRIDVGVGKGTVFNEYEFIGHG